MELKNISKNGFFTVISVTFAIILVAFSFTACTTAPSFTEEEVTFSNIDEELPATLAGTLALPKSKNPVPAVLLITGSGYQDRDETIFGFKPFLIISDHLANNGIAVLRYDDRGIGGSTGDMANATTEDFALDANAGVEYLLTRREIDPTKIGILGHSEGGSVAPIVENMNENVSFLILMAGMTMPGDELLLEQGRSIMETQGMEEEQILRKNDLQRLMFRAIRTGDGWSEVEEGLKNELAEAYDGLSEQDKALAGERETFIANQIDAQMAGLQTPWLKFFVNLNPANYFKNVDEPILAIFGELDVQVPAESNSKALESAMAGAEGSDLTIKVIPKANHLFQAAETGSLQEYTTLEKQFVDGFLDEISNWILEKTTDIEEA